MATRARKPKEIATPHSFEELRAAVRAITPPTLNVWCTVNYCCSRTSSFRYESIHFEIWSIIRGEHFKARAKTPAAVWKEFRNKTLPRMCRFSMQAPVEVVPPREIDVAEPLEPQALAWQPRGYLPAPEVT